MSDGKLSSRGRTDREGSRSARGRRRSGHPAGIEVYGTAGESHLEAVGLSPSPSESGTRARRGQPGGLRQLLAVSPMTVRSWEQGSRQPSPIGVGFSRRSKWHRATSVAASLPPRSTWQGQAECPDQASTRKIVRAKSDEGMRPILLRKRERCLHRWPYACRKMCSI